MESELPPPAKRARIQYLSVALRMSAECGDDLWRLVERAAAFEHKFVVFGMDVLFGDALDAEVVLRLRVEKGRARMLERFVRELLEELEELDEAHVMLETLNFHQDFDGTRDGLRARSLPERLLARATEVEAI